VGFLNGLIGKWLGFPKETVDTLMLIGLLHDCGKAMAPRQILRAPRALSVVEYEVIKMHTDHGYSILDDFPETVRHGARSHHENYNGTGYPDGASGVAIPLLARITALSDIYDAMTARRCYKEPQSPFHVLSILKKMRSTILDPMLVDLFLENMPQELVDKPVMLSDGNIGIIHAIDPKNLEYPKVMTRGRIVKCDRDLYCKHMHFE
jgi:HD-GYP domain-containing protein (c-di-GMP phosphodiesterase class II)